MKKEDIKGCLAAWTGSLQSDRSETF